MRHLWDHTSVYGDTLGKGTFRMYPSLRVPTASQAVHNSLPERKAKQKKNSQAFEQRFLEKNGHHRDSDWNKDKNAHLELLKSNFVRRIASNEEIFPDKNEADNVHIRDGTMTRFRREAGLKLTPKSELDRRDANVKALLSLVDGCKKKDPKAVAFIAVDSEFKIPKDGTIVESMSEVAAGAYNYQGVRIKEFSVVKKSGKVDENDLDDLKTFIDENGTGKPLFCWGSAEQPLFRYLGRPDGVDAKMVKAG